MYICFLSQSSCSLCLRGTRSAAAAARGILGVQMCFGVTAESGGLALLCSCVSARVTLRKNETSTALKRAPLPELALNGQTLSVLDRFNS